MAKKKKDKVADRKIVALQNKAEKQSLQNLATQLANANAACVEQQREIEELECIIDDLTTKMARQRRVRRIAQLCIYEDISPYELVEYMFGTDEDDDDDEDDEDEDFCDSPVSACTCANAK